MPHPKRKTSKSRRDKRRTHQNASYETLSLCPTTGSWHKRHFAHVEEGNLYYRGRVLIENVEKIEE